MDNFKMNVADMTTTELDAWIRVCGQWMCDRPEPRNAVPCGYIVRQCAAEKLRRVKLKNDRS
jgi:hypothetical protein